MGVCRVVSVSGGKDSTALYLWAIEQFGKNGFRAVFADTGHEHPVTLNYLRNLPALAGGPEITWVRRDFREKIKKRITEPPQRERSDQAQGMLDRNRDWLEKAGWTSGSAFLDLIIWKGRVPSTKAQFCTENLKLIPIRDYIESVRGDDEVENYVGIRAGESARGKSRMNWLEQCEKARLALTREKRQEFLDLMLQGKTLGEAAEISGISFDAANGILRHQIGHFHFLNRKAD